MVLVSVQFKVFFTSTEQNPYSCSLFTLHTRGLFVTSHLFRPVIIFLYNLSQTEIFVTLRFFTTFINKVTVLNVPFHIFWIFWVMVALGYAACLLVLMKARVMAIPIKLHVEGDPLTLVSVAE